MNRSPPSPIAPDVLEAELEYLIKDGSCYTSSPIFSDDESVTFTQIDDLKISRSPQAVSPITRERPATDHFIQMVKGPEVEIFVGPKKRCFQLPKKLLAYYSPVFDRCFSGEFVEGETQKMECPEDTVEDFEVLLEYILYSNATNALSITKNAENTADGCISFVVFADNYDLGDVSSDVYSLLRPALVKYGKSGFKATYIEDLFGATRQGSCL